MKEIGLSGKGRDAPNRFAVTLDAPDFAEIGNKIMCSYSRDYFSVNHELVVFCNLDGVFPARYELNMYTSV